MAVCHGVKNGIVNIDRCMERQFSEVTKLVRDVEKRQDELAKSINERERDIKWNKIYIEALQKSFNEVNDKTSERSKTNKYRIQCLEETITKIMNCLEDCNTPLVLVEEVTGYIDSLIMYKEESSETDEAHEHKKLLNNIIDDTIHIYRSKQIQTIGEYTTLVDIIKDLENYNDVCHMIDRLHVLKQRVDELHNKGATSSSAGPSNCVLTCTNVIQEAIVFYKNNNLSTTDILETIQEMLHSKQYTLSESFMSSKLNFEEVKTYFLSAIAPKKVKTDDLHKLLFKSVVCEYLI
jgi:hypothetical protein